MTCVLWGNQSVTVHWNPVGVAVFGSPFGSLETLHPWANLPDEGRRYSLGRVRAGGKCTLWR